MAYQERRRQMRADDVPEAEMNALFDENQVFVESLFDASGQKGVVGAFEGGGYMAEGLYRSAQNCIMFTRTKDFCAVCSEAIEKVIGVARLGLRRAVRKASTRRPAVVPSGPGAYLYPQDGPPGRMRLQIRRGLRGNFRPAPALSV